MAQGLSTPDPSLNPTHLSIRRGRATTTQYTHHQVSPMVSRNTTLVPSLGLRIGLACEAGLSAGMRRERVPPRIRNKESHRKDFVPDGVGRSTEDSWGELKSLLARALSIALVNSESALDRFLTLLL